VKALTLIQPWASLIIDGRKTIETRKNAWSHRGPVAIHAGLKVDREACIRFGYNPDTIPRGAVLGLVNMYDCVRFPDLRTPPDEYGDFTPGRHGYLLQWAKPFSSPIPARGYQTLGWEWEP
jgi:activating signal cointegrator 1